MSVFIKGMKMPKSCAECRFNSHCDGCQGYVNYCAAMEEGGNIGYDRDGYGKTVPAGVEITPTDHRQEWCPLEEEPTATWVKADSAQFFRKHHPSSTCSRCNYRKSGKWNYCPNCGARMIYGNG